MEWLADNIGIPYPLALPVISGKAIELFVVDAMVSYPETYAAEPVILHSISFPSNEIEVRLQSGTVLLDDAAIFTTYALNAEYSVYVWQQSNAYLGLVVKIADIVAGDYAPGVPFVPSVVYRSPIGVRAIRVEVKNDDGSTTTHEFNATTGFPTFESGYNAKFTGTAATDADTVINHPVRLDFIAGAGDGRYNNCEEPVSEILRINGVGPDAAGDFKLTGDDCIVLAAHRIGDDISVPTWSKHGQNWLTQEGQSIPDSDGLAIWTACAACCQCQDYADHYEAVKQMMRESYVDILSRLNLVNNKLGSCIGLHQSVSRKLEKVHIKSFLFPKYGWLVGCQVTVANSYKGADMRGVDIPAGTQIQISFDAGNAECRYKLKSATWLYPEDKAALTELKNSSGGAITETDSSDTWPRYVAVTPKKITQGGWATFTFYMNVCDTTSRTSGSPISLTAKILTPQSATHTASAGILGNEPPKK